MSMNLVYVVFGLYLIVTTICFVALEKKRIKDEKESYKKNRNLIYYRDEFYRNE